MTGVGEYPDFDYLCYLSRDVVIKIFKKYFFRKNERTWKPSEGKELGSGETPLTVADQLINDMVLKKLSKDFPRVSAIGEEGRREVPGARYKVIWDPIDGTHAFMAGLPTCAFAITVLENNIPIVALIFDPLCHRFYWAEKNGSAWNRKKDMTVSAHGTLSRAQMAMIWWGGCRFHMHEVAGQLMKARATVSNPLSLVYPGALVATGQMEAAMFPGHNIWEAAALKCIVEAAGGKVTDLFGEPLKFDGSPINGCLVSNGLLHDQIVEIVKKSQ